MTTYNLRTQGLIHSPGIFRWVMDAVLPFDNHKASEVLLALGIPEPVALALVDRDPAVTYEYQDDLVLIKDQRTDETNDK